MMSKPNNAPTRVALGDRPRPVRVRVFRVDGKIAKAHPLTAREKIGGEG